MCHRCLISFSLTVCTVVSKQSIFRVSSLISQVAELVLLSLLVSPILTGARPQQKIQVKDFPNKTPKYAFLNGTCISLYVVISTNLA